jgi:hypothetical protein
MSHQTLKRSCLGQACRSLVMLLCICIMVQMLGVPVTLLHPAANSDALEASVLEGFSVPPSLPHLMLSSESVPLIESHPSGQAPVLASVPFHPPVL